MRYDSRKVGIVGLGNVGVTAAYALLLNHLADELVLISRSKEKAEGEKLDLEHGLPFLENTSIVATDDYSALEGCDAVVIAAGAAQKPGQTRLDLVTENKKIMDNMIPQMQLYVQNSVIIMVTNPVDVLTYHVSQLLNLPPGRVIGSGTLLDTARFRFHLSEFLDVNPRSIHAYILGEHGDSSFPVLSSANIGGELLDHFPRYTRDRALEAYQKAKDAAYRIINSKGATYYAIGVVISHLLQAVIYDKRTVLPITAPIFNYYGQKDVSVSVPCVVGRGGAEQLLRVPLSEEEQAQFIASCDVIRKLL